MLVIFIKIISYMYTLTVVATKSVDGTSGASITSKQNLLIVLASDFV